MNNWIALTAETRPTKDDGMIHARREWMGCVLALDVFGDMRFTHWSSVTPSKGYTHWMKVVLP